MIKEKRHIRPERHKELARVLNDVQEFILSVQDDYREYHNTVPGPDFKCLDKLGGEILQARGALEKAYRQCYRQPSPYFAQPRDNGGRDHEA